MMNIGIQEHTMKMCEGTELNKIWSCQEKEWPLMCLLSKLSIERFRFSLVAVLIWLFAKELWLQQNIYPVWTMSLYLYHFSCRQIKCNISLARMKIWPHFLVEIIRTKYWWLFHYRENYSNFSSRMNDEMGKEMPLT